MDAQPHRQLLQELDAYLSRSPAETIHAGSIFHQQIKQALLGRHICVDRKYHIGVKERCDRCSSVPPVETPTPSDRLPDATPAHTCGDGIVRLGTRENCSVCILWGVDQIAERFDRGKFATGGDDVPPAASLSDDEPDPLASVRWVCSTCGTTNSIARETCFAACGGQRPRAAEVPPPAPLYDRDKYPTACLAVEAFIDEYVDGYEMVGEDEQGREGHYTPGSDEDALIRDAIAGLHGDEDFVTLIGAEYAERQARRAAEGSCLTCGAPAGQHWGRRCNTVESPL